MSVRYTKAGLAALITYPAVVRFVTRVVNSVSLATLWTPAGVLTRGLAPTEVCIAANTGCSGLMLSVPLGYQRPSGVVAIIYIPTLVIERFSGSSAIQVFVPPPTLTSDLT